MRCGDVHGVDTDGDDRRYYLTMTADEVLKCLLTLPEDALTAAVGKKKEELPELVRRLVARGQSPAPAAEPSR